MRANFRGIPTNKKFQLKWITPSQEAKFFGNSSSSDDKDEVVDLMQQQRQPPQQLKL